MSENRVSINRGTVKFAALTANGSTGAADLGTACRTFTFQSVTTGTPTSFTLTYQGSLDNVNWFTLGSSTAAAGDAQFVIDKPAQYVRATLSALTGGTSPTITVFMGACG